MPNLKRTLLSTIFAKDIPKLSKYAEEHSLKNYDKASAIYNQILQSSRKDIGTDDFIECVYKMLEAFKMNSQRAKLSDLPDFKKSIKEHVGTIQSLTK